VQKLNKMFALKINDLFQGQPTCKFLEIGPGVGAFADILHSVMKGKLDYYGIEANPTLCEQGMKKGYTMYNGAVPPFPTDKAWKGFDCMYLSHVVEHFPDFTSLTGAFAGMHESLRENGYLILFVPDYLDWKEDFFNGDYSHSYVTTQRRLRELVNDMGLSIDLVRTYRACFPAPVSALIYPLHCLVKFLAGTVYHHFLPADVLFKMKITFARNILIVCRKKNKTAS